MRWRGSAAIWAYVASTAGAGSFQRLDEVAFREEQYARKPRRRIVAPGYVQKGLEIGRRDR